MTATLPMNGRILRVLQILPMTGPVDLTGLLRWRWHREGCAVPSEESAASATELFEHAGFGAVRMDEPLKGVLARPDFDIVVVGGGDEPIHPDWVRAARDQCEAAGVAFVFVGWGAYRLAGVDEQYGPGCLCLDESGFIDDCHPGMVGYANESYGVVMIRVGHAASGRILDGKTHDWPGEVQP